MVAALNQSRCASAALVVAIIAAGIDPLQSIWRPRLGPAAAVVAVVVAVEEGPAKERKAIEAVTEERAMTEAVPASKRAP